MFKTLMSLCAAASLLAACGSVAPQGLIAAARLDPLETPPGDITVAVSVPDTLRLRDGDAVLRLAFVPEDAAAAAPVDATVPLSISTTTPGPRAAQAGETIYVLGFSPQNAAVVSKAQSQIKDLKAGGIEGEGSLSIGVEGGCMLGTPGDTLKVATWLRTGPEAQFVMLTRPTDFYEALAEEERAALKAEIKAC